jgi:hypothetical protein
VEVFLLDNESTDHSVEIANSFRNKNLIGIDTIPRGGSKNLLGNLLTKEKLVDRLDCDWVLNTDVDEIRFSPWSDTTLKEAVEVVEGLGFNAVNFMEFTFVPTEESPDHEHEQFLETMRYYYPFARKYPQRINLWRKQPRPTPPPRWKRGLKRILGQVGSGASIDLHSSGGHEAKFPNRVLYPVDFIMRHYMVLSFDHAIRKYVKIKNSEERPKGWHQWRGRADDSTFRLPRQEELLYFNSNQDLNPSSARREHLIISKNR